MGAFRLNPIQQEFEKWLSNTYLSEAEWDDSRNCYKEHRVHMAWQAWRASAARLLTPLGGTSLPTVPGEYEGNRDD